MTRTPRCAFTNFWSESLLSKWVGVYKRCLVCLGSTLLCRIVDYPGEDTFDGDIRYGMNDDICYDRLPGRNVAILGNGAFAIENARPSTCLWVAFMREVRTMGF
eukprot:3748920-Amphidinium_carterae.1